MERDGFEVVRVCHEDIALQFSKQLQEAGDEPYCDAMWNLRRLVHPVFATRWGTADLLTSFDGHGYRAPYTSWSLPWHVDQGATHGDGRACVQGVLALTPVTAQTGGTVLLRGSHSKHAQWIARVDTDLSAWESFRVHRHRKELAACDSVFPSLKAGELLLFDSRVVHRVAAPTVRSTVRHVAYVCMTPASMASADVLCARRSAVESGIRTTHWPHRFVAREHSCVGRLWDDLAPDERAMVVGL